jgi:two-component system chemotaxis sensor kinase CheA
MAMMGINMNQRTENNEILFSFIDASTPILEEIEEIIQQLKTEPDATALLNTYFRLLYTLKGTALCVGLKSIPQFAQSYGELIGKLQWQQVVLTTDIMDALSQGLSQLKYMYAEARLGNFETEVVAGFDLGKTVNTKTVCHNEVTSEKIGVSINILDKFMELSGQFTVLRNTLTKSAMELEQRYYGDKELEMMVDSLAEMHKVSTTLQNDIAEMRKISIDVIYNSVRRIANDSATSLGKYVDLKVEGEDLKIDTSISKILSNALVHIVRNSIDHGIETPEARVAAGKHKNGNLHLKSYENADNIIVEFSDDGAGLSLSRIKQKAVENKLFTHDQLEAMSEQKIFSIIFEEGFSTSATITDVSDSGSGMDIVRSSVEEVGGKILINSHEGNGAKFVLIIPTPRSVLIIKSLMIKFGSAVYSIPLDAVAEVVCLEEFKDSKVLHHIENSLILRHHEELLPLVDLAKAISSEGNTAQENVLNVVIVKSEGFKFGIIVDEILDIQEIVVKKMSAQLKVADYFMGVTFIGHGELALILDLAMIAKKFEIKHIENSATSSQYLSEAIQTENMEFMQFNFKNSKNYAFPLVAVNRLEEIKTMEIEFSGAIPLVRYRDESLPLLFIERQLKLCSTTDSLITSYPDVLKVIVVNLHNKIFGIVVDQILDIGITNAQIETDSVDREGFLGTIFIADKTVTILDVSYLIENYLDFEHAAAEKEFVETHVEEEWHINKAA